MTRRELCRITADLCDTRENREIWREYWNAIRANDDERLKWFASMGRDARQRIMNVYEYRLGLLYGFIEIKFDEYGWLKNADWQQVETIQLRVKHKVDKNGCATYIKLGCGFNGRWTYAVHYQTSAWAANGYGLHVHWKRPYKSRHEALVAALDEVKHEMSRALRHGQKHQQDILNYDLPYIQKVLDKIHATYPKEYKQLALAF